MPTSTQAAVHEPRARPRVRAIDGLRGVAIAGVLAYHAAPSLVPGGFLGVEVFFVLSGYLLTALLLDEHRRTGAFDWWRYVRRRVRRIGPALFVFLMALVVIGSIVASSDAYRLRADVVWSALGLTNWHLIDDGNSYFAQLGRPPLVRHLWSLAIEIQFYALVPALVTWLVRRRRRHALLALAGGITASSVAMALLASGADSSRAYYGTGTRVGGLLAGTLLAFVLAGDGAEHVGRPRRWLSLAGVGGVMWLVQLFLTTDDASSGLYPGTFLACRLATMLVILGAFQPGALADALGSGKLCWLGLRSYSIYLWHWPLLVLLRPGIDVDWPPALAVGSAVLGALFLGNLSFLYLERPFLRRRSQISPRVGPRLVHATAVSVMTLAAVASVALLLRLPSIDPIANSLAAGQELLAARAEAAAGAEGATLSLPPILRLTATTTTVATTLPTTAPPTLPTTVAPPPPPPPLVPSPRGNTATLIGDSVMLSAAQALDRRFAATVYVNATLSRQFTHAVDVVRALRAEGVLAGSVVVHLGTNGTPEADDVDALMADLAGSRDVLLVTVRTPQRWQSEANATLLAAQARHPSLRIVDWYAHSEGRLDWFESDGTHVKPAGALAYAELLATALGVPPPAPPAPPVPAAATDG